MPIPEKIAHHRARFPELDSLRGIAVVSVLLYHYTVAYDQHFKINSPGHFHFRFGFLAVELFFIISGFVIFLTLDNTRKSADFLVSRFSRLYPAYWAAIAITLLTLYFLPVPTLGHFTMKEVLLNVTMFEGFFKGVHPIDQVYWTLKFELTFYIIMYLLFVGKALRHISRFCYPWLLLSLLSCLFPIPLKKYLDVLLILQYAPLFVAGIHFYKLKKNPGERQAHLLILLSLIVQLPWVWHMNIDDSNDYAVMGFIILFYAIFYWFVFKGLPFLNHRVLVFFGTISYSLYLLHNVIGYCFIYRLRAIVDKQIFYVPLTFAISVSIASFVSFAIEKPAMKSIRSWYKRRGSRSPKDDNPEAPPRIGMAVEQPIS
jgi:peptidoglycan/LPS O-acetylase OafA/YrhL